MFGISNTRDNIEKRHKEIMSMIGRIKEEIDKKKRYIDILEKDNRRLREENEQYRTSLGNVG